MLYIEILAVILLTLVNGILAMSELAVVSSRKSRLVHLANQGNHGARAALRLMEEPSRFLSTIQIGITLVGIIAGAFSGATLGQRLGNWLNTFTELSPYGDTIGICATVVGIAYLSLILGELVPKRMALAQPERIASLLAGPMRGLSLIAAPAIWVLQASTERVLRLLGLAETRQTSITEDEIKLLIAEGTQAGIFVPMEQTMIEGVLRLADRPIRVIMTPRSRIFWVDVRAGRNEILDMIGSNRFSRLLVCDGTVDRPVGFIHSKNLLPEAMRCEDFALAELMTPLLFAPDNTAVLRLLSRFKKEKVHIAVVVDEYGTTEGIVTLTDVIEAIAGDLPEQGEDLEPRIMQRDNGSWLVDGTLPTDEVEAVTGIDMGKDVKTIAGFMLQHLRKIPKAGDMFACGDAQFEVVDMDGNRIDKVLIQIDGRAAGPQKTSSK